MSFKGKKQKSRGKCRGSAKQERANLIYGRNPVYEALKAGRRHVSQVLFSEAMHKHVDAELMQLCQVRQVSHQYVPIDELHHLTNGAVHQGVAAHVDAYPHHDFEDVFLEAGEKRLVLALDCVQDPQNFGTLCRSALAFGVKDVILPKDRSVPITGSVCKASAGAIEHLRVIYVTNLARALEKFKKEGFWTYGASLAEEALDLKSLDPAPKSVVVLGSEGEGLRRLVAENCDQLVKIGMKSGFDSLNVGQAGTVILYEFSGKVFYSPPYKGGGADK